MNERTVVIVSILLLVGAVAACGLFLGLRAERPPGQKGLKGTRLESSPALYRLQMGGLAVLLMVCLIAAACVLWS